MLSQPDLINRLLDHFKDRMVTTEYATPAVAGSHVITNAEANMLSDEEQSFYRSGVGSLLFLLKHSRPELSNCVRKLSKAMDGANEAHRKALLRTI